MTALNTGQQQVGAILLLGQWFLLGRSPSWAGAHPGQGAARAECTRAGPVLSSGSAGAGSRARGTRAHRAALSSFEEKGDEDEKEGSALGSRRWRD